MEFSQDSTFYSLSPESIIHTDLDLREEGAVLASFDEDSGGTATEEREVQMDESPGEARLVFGLEVVQRHCHRVLFYSWHLADAAVGAIRSGCLKLIRSIRFWHGRESVRRAAETIRLLLSYLSLFGGCASAGGAGGARTLISPFSVSKTRSRQGVFTDCNAQRVFSCSDGTVFQLAIPGFSDPESVAGFPPIFQPRSSISEDL